MSTVFNSYWGGCDLPPYARLSINSYVKQGHKYLLWTHDDLKNVPDGVIVKDANEIIPRQAFYERDNWKKCLSFSDWFRYKLLYERGGWWVDTDAVMMPGAEVPEGEIIFWRGASYHVMNGIMKVTPGMKFLRELCDLYERPLEDLDYHWIPRGSYARDKKDLTKGDASEVRAQLNFNYGGPDYFGHAIQGYKLLKYGILFDAAGKPQAVWPDWKDASLVFSGKLTLQGLRCKNVWNLHLWGSCIRREKLWDNIHPDSAVQQLIDIFGC